MLMQPFSHIFTHRGHNLMLGIIASHLNVAGARLELRGIILCARRRVKLVTMACEMKHGSVCRLV